ncbi:hypothetical protein [Nocardiopsis suaedae]|uniref:Nuclear transport factor 2 family protein n=1 Tax=Nocardiopsis suaedae TaxID=3018444 RepID=A0ABT4TTD6_9ACTN|nr:hypothetical protein [Nocardiopsis suaedae]MDA2807711.1 hypothetical protein [Nocardiopsis suaedae]
MTDGGPDTAAAVERYLEFWSAETTERRRALAPGVFTGDVGYRSPVGAMDGPEALVDFGAQFNAHMGAVAYVARREPESHNGRVRLLWEIRLPDGTSFAEGTDVLTVAPDGRVESVTAFLDREPEGFEHGTDGGDGGDGRH